ncbi:NUDIX domain-containing protein [Lactobacillus delbrueckii subsp. lactis DSM 20072]|uniref:NUDIX hydrolase n=1 Tax=Lactobacillus delbrueckii TaxID=1584 RepID=UPI0003055443|nr:NUDIX hydrolase [Lactobacillus delbrueckii]ASW12463.1 NUDIX domain-containing protein [Lactobacillus delbrueckii subsp. lactis DSM 20072]MCT3501015.1 NUDIX domain-containing protein [Lactobacillus delbrueckii subsp. lactis]OOV03231.1 NUDIX hydrolase [Lactobacillus delbrueckii subsp. lactis DSM 20072]OOV11232.1 NUDIX hydrolase [Lactobacillus delbrueckii subsp. lactis DSM 20072]
MTLLTDLKNYQPFNEQEAADVKEMIYRLETGEELFLRSNLAEHFTASAWVVNPARDKALMAYHRIYDSWAWLGGHADGDQDLLHVALKEVAEESGVKATPVTDQIYSVEILTVDGHEKKGKYVPSHLHLNVTYLLEADDSLPIRPKEDENKAVAWFGLDEALEKSTKSWFVDRIYSKLNAKLKDYPAR